MEREELHAWIVEADIASMQDGMERGAFTSEELVRTYLERIEQYNPRVNAVLECNPDALEIARALDRERAETGSRGPLHGIPILVKDNIDTHDRMHTSAGSIALRDSIAKQDSFVAAQLRKAGAVLLGKANMTEWANYMSSSMMSGYSSRGGQVINPYGTIDMFVGGSSSGSGAAVAANLCAAAIGTETSGSIICPASQNFAVGIKPTIGLVSRSGIIPIAHSQDTAGPIARTVADAAILLGALVGMDELDEVTREGSAHAHADYTEFLDAAYVQHARIGIPRYYYRDLDEERLTILEAAIEQFRHMGATIVDPVSLPCEAAEWDWSVLCYEFKHDLNRYLAHVDETVPVHSLQDVIAYNEQHAETALKYGQDILIRSEQTSGTLTEEDYLKSKQKNREMAGTYGIDAVLDEHSLDALLFLSFEAGADLAARAGYPSLTVPAGYATQGVMTESYATQGPIGLTLVGRAYSEPVLIKIAYGYEQATHHRFPPALD